MDTQAEFSFVSKRFLESRWEHNDLTGTDSIEFYTLPNDTKGKEHKQR